MCIRDRYYTHDDTGIFDKETEKATMMWTAAYGHGPDPIFIEYVTSGDEPIRALQKLHASLDSNQKSRASCPTLTSLAVGCAPLSRGRPTRPGRLNAPPGAPAAGRAGSTGAQAAAQTVAESSEAPADGVSVTRSEGMAGGALYGAAIGAVLSGRAAPLGAAVGAVFGAAVVSVAMGDDAPPQPALPSPPSAPPTPPDYDT
eukprot:1566166-Prymnesium_polylepis.1